MMNLVNFNKKMKNTLILFALTIGFNTFSQNFPTSTTSNDFLGTWEWQNGTETFRVVFFNDSTYDGSQTIRGHFALLETDVNGNETLIYTSDRLIEGTDQNWIPMINGGRYLDYNDSYRFSLRDNTTDSFLLGVLDLKFLNVSSQSSLLVSWKLRVDGMADEDQNFNVPTDIILTKVE